ncbi:MAG: ROK family protein [Actinobacteria bacterium]|nr:MAG: ROK family protein [Actinomycetota bacterium]
MVPSALEPRVIGVDVGGTKTLAAVVASDGSIERRLLSETDTSSSEAQLDQLDRVVEQVRDGAEVTALGFGLPSRIDQRSGRAVASVNIPLEGVDFRDRMHARHGLPVGIDNDANAAAIGEWKAGAARGARYVVMLTLGTGVGGGLILDDRPYRGATGTGAELGHIVIERDGLPCGCGGHGHLESYAAGPASDARAVELFGAGSHGAELVARAKEGHAGAIAALAEIGRALGAGIASFVNVFEPELVVVGGGFGTAAGELLLAPAREVLAVEGLVPSRDRVRVVPAELGVEAGVIGAGMIAFEALRES